MSTGRGYVFWVPSTGSVSAVVSGGTNMNGWVGWDDAWRNVVAMKEKSEKDFIVKKKHLHLVDEIRRQLFHDDDEIDNIENGGENDDDDDIDNNGSGGC